MKLKLFLGSRQAHFTQDYQNLALIASSIFGGGEAGRDQVEDGDVIQTKEQAELAFKSVFG